MNTARPFITVPPRADRVDRLAPGLFVLLWSTGFIAGKAGVQDSGPFHLLLERFVLAALLLGLAALLRGARWPDSRRSFAQLALAGALVHAGYLGGVFSALRAGVGAGQVAMIVGLQPVLTAICAALLLGEQIPLRRWCGLLLGCLGVLLVLWPRLQQGSGWHAGLPGLPAALLALVSISLGTVLQKHYCQGMDLRSGGAIQYGVCALLMLVLLACSPGADRPPMHSLHYLLALAWLVLVLSVGAIGLLYRLLRHGAASRVASLFYLVPVVTTLMGMAFFGEHLTLLSALGMLLVSAAVALSA